MHPVRVNQTHGIPALMSFFIPGLGQLIKGQVGKSVILFTAFVVFVISIVGSPIALILWLWGVYDAYNA